ncbi:MAG: hypothetical protein HY303_12685 [Candidatus Wallbacteria bacterium]|nr:hypothetical protein [Candidatus Wallbacteria bacterium]
MLALLILLVFAAGAALAFTRALPILLVLPLMGIAVALLVVPPWETMAALGTGGAALALAKSLQEISRDVIGAGALMLHPAYATIIAGAMVAGSAPR